METVQNTNHEHNQDTALLNEATSVMSTDGQPLDEGPMSGRSAIRLAFKYLAYYFGLTIVGGVLILLPSFILFGICGLCIPGASAWSLRDWSMSWFFIGSQLLPLYVAWKRKWCDFGWKKTPHLGRLLLWMLVAWLAYTCIEVFFDQVFSLVGIDTNSQQSILDDEILPLALISISVLAPLTEEALFRGTIERKMLASDRGPWFAIGVSAVLFALMHADVFVTSMTFMMGLFMGWIYYRTRNVWLTIILHAFNNTVSAIMLLVTGSFDFVTDGAEADYPFYVYLAFLAVGLVLMCVAVSAIKRITARDDNTAQPGNNAGNTSINKPISLQD